MCIGLNFLAVNGADKPYYDNKNSGHSDLKQQLGKKDEKVFDRGIVSIEVHPLGSLISQKVADWFFKVDEEGTLPAWFDSNVWKTRCIDETLMIVRKVEKIGIFNGNLDLHGTQITSLPQGLKVGGNLYLQGTQITSTPKHLKSKVIF